MKRNSFDHLRDKRMILKVQENLLLQWTFESHPRLTHASQIDSFLSNGEAKVEFENKQASSPKPFTSREKKIKKVDNVPTFTTILLPSVDREATVDV